MIHLKRALTVLVFMFAPAAAAQDDLAVKVPDPLFEAESAGLAELRLWSMDKWLMVRKTNHPLYHYALGAARFRAYLSFCRRHDQKVDLPVLNEMALKNLSEIIVAHYEETEWSKFSGMDEAAIRTWIADLGQDIYAFEYATAIAEKREAKERGGMTTQAFCTSIAKESHDDYIALRAIAKRQLKR